MRRYHIIKNKYQGNVEINYRHFDGFKVKPRNKVKHEGIRVDSLTVTNRSFIDQVLKKKTKKKLELYLQYIISIIDDEESTDPNGVLLALNDLVRYKGIIDFKYRKYLDEKYIELLLKKIELLERELKRKIIHLEQKVPLDPVYEEEKSHRSR